MKKPRYIFPIVALLAWVAIISTWIATDLRSSSESAPAGSVFDTDDTGTSLLYGYLSRRLGSDSVRLLETLIPSTSPDQTVVFRIESGDVFLQEAAEYRPSRKVDKSSNEREASDPKTDGSDETNDEDPSDREATSPVAPEEEDFVRAGGRLVLSPGCARGVTCTERVQQEESTKVFPIWPGVDAVVLSDPKAFMPETMGRCHSILNTGTRSQICREVIGRGEIIRVASPEIFLNSGIGEGDHLLLVESLIRDRTRVFIDERIHGLGASPGLTHLLISEWRLGPSLVLGALAFALWMARGRSSIGPRMRADQIERSEAVDLVDSLGTLFSRTVSEPEALRLYRKTLEREEAWLRRKGRSVDIADIVMPPGSFDARLEHLNSIFRRILDAEHRSNR
ncbi:MAG: hypothetical protein KY459_13140 [Acidobacteria bacterium]|nr:hypothetical protein [Acidobacteriota bacterium]